MHVIGDVELFKLLGAHFNHCGLKTGGYKLQGYTGVIFINYLHTAGKLSGARIGLSFQPAVFIAIQNPVTISIGVKRVGAPLVFFQVG